MKPGDPFLIIAAVAFLAWVLTAHPFDHMRDSTSANNDSGYSTGAAERRGR